MCAAEIKTAPASKKTIFNAKSSFKQKMRQSYQPIAKARKIERSCRVHASKQAPNSERQAESKAE
jgi:hypothetical protein